MSSKKKKKNQVDWIIHLVANGEACECCGEVENGFLDYACNAHTHGMEKYNHPDFQMVLRYSNEDICSILNELGLRVQAGERFHAGQYVSGIFTDCDVRLDEFEETGRTVLRVMIPDGKNRFPDDKSCDAPFTLQMLETDALYRDTLFS